MKKIPLSNGRFSFVDDQDYNLVSKYKWHCQDGPNLYAIRNVTINGKHTSQQMHRLILGLGQLGDTGVYVDHINGNSLDNRRLNLRLCTNQQNAINSKIPKSNTTGIKGVTYIAKTGRWRAVISNMGKRINLGTHPTKEQAMISYREKCIELYGEFSRFE